MRTEDLIVQLAESVRPVRPIASPARRLARWAVVAIPLTMIGAAVIGVRPDAWQMAREPAFLAAAVLTLGTALIAAAAALRLSIPGADTRADRWVPVTAATLWVAWLAVLLAAGGSALDRLLAPPLHLACVIEILGLALVPGWALFVILRQAAPLRLGWSAGLATLAAVSLAAVATQVICPIDDPAHQIAGHALPAAIFVLAGVVWGRRPLDWPHRADQKTHRHHGGPDSDRR